MADENPASNPSDDDSTKKDTIRITLPPKADQPGAKRETVRIDVPGASGQSSVQAPKKETSKVSIPGFGSTPPAPPPPKPPGPTISGTMPPPKPPALASKPTIPLRPGPPGPPSGAMPPPPPPSSGVAAPPPSSSGVMAKPVSPKKETARIILPSEAPKSSGPALPKATVKMQQTQPLSKSVPPTSGVRTMVTTTSSVAQGSASTSPAKPDTLTIVFSVLAFVGSIAALAFAYFAYTAAQLPDWAK